jgi:hypothetical protein
MNIGLVFGLFIKKIEKIKLEGKFPQTLFRYPHFPK